MGGEKEEAEKRSCSSENLEEDFPSSKKICQDAVEGSILLAVESGDYESVKTLVKKDVSAVMCKNGRGMTPLLIAASLGHINIVRFLLNYGAPWNSLDDEGLSAGDHARIFGSTDSLVYKEVS